MLHVLLLILKILLIVILSILGLVIFLLLVVLFAPIRYRVYASKYEDILAKFKVSFLGFVFCFKGMYEKSEGFNYKLQTFGFSLKDSQKEKTSNEESSNQVIDEDEKPKKLSRKEKKALKNNESKQLNKEIEISEIKQEVKSEIQAEVQSEIQEDVKEESFENRFNYNVSRDESFDNRFNSNVSKLELDKEDEEFLNKEDPKEKPGVFIKLGGFISKAVSSTKSKVENITTKVSSLKDKADAYQNFLKKKETKATIEYAKKIVIKVLKHIAPKRIKGELRYGSGDPAKTGKNIGYMSIALPLYYDKIEIYPDFENKVLEGYISLKGRIRLGTLAIIALKVYLNKNVKITIKRVKRLTGGNE